MIRRIAIVAGAALALVPAAASAATEVDSAEGVVLVTGDVAANSITVSADAKDVLISDTTGTVTDTNDADDCQQDGPSRVRCDTLKGLETVFVSAGEGNDTLSADTAIVFVRLVGQAGDDVLNSGPEGVETEMTGGEGNDTLNARTGTIGSSDVGGPGNDTFNGNPQDFDDFEQDPGADIYNGGTPTFTGPYCGIDPELCRDQDQMNLPTGPVTVTLDGVANDGRAGENDNVGADVEHVFASAANDTLSAAGTTTARRLFGEGGDDAITGGSGDDLLDGGGGADQLAAGGGDDVLRSGDEDKAPAADRLDGGDGDDFFATGIGADDVIGGTGLDSVSFDRSNPDDSPVSFDITLDDQPNDGPKGAGEGDNVHADVDIVSTGDGADRIIGSAAAQQLYGGFGNDEIDGGAGVDVIDGGNGVDSIVSRDRGFDVVNCGDGVDATVQGDEGDRLENCEAVALVPLPPPPDTAKPQVTLSGATRISARSFARSRSVTVTAKTSETSSLLGEAVVRGKIARAGDLVIGEKKLALANAGSRKVRIRFGRRDVRAINKRLRRRAFTLTVRVTATDAAGNTKTATRRVTIRKR